MPKLLEQARDIIRRRNYSHRTESTYIHWMRRFILFHQMRHSAEMGVRKVTDFLNQLVTKCNARQNASSRYWLRTRGIQK